VTISARPQAVKPDAADLRRARGDPTRRVTKSNALALFDTVMAYSGQVFTCG
jgi:hypothetical protein